MKKLIIIVGGIVVLALLLAGAAFVGGRLLNGQGFARGPSSDRLDIQPAKELPQTAADLRGLFDHRQDNSIFVGTEKFANGPIVEVVATTQTIIYCDVTSKQFIGRPPQGQKIQQVVEPGSLDEIGQDSAITVWGRKTGDRFIADVLVYTTPEFK